VAGFAASLFPNDPHACIEWRSFMPIMIAMKTGFSLARLVDTSELEDEIARLRDLDLPTLRARWRSVFRRKAPAPLPRHLLFRILAYRLKAERLGDLDKETVRLLDRIASGNGGNGHRSVVGKQSRFDRLQPGSMLVREWDGARQRPAFPEYSANGAVAGLNTALR